MQKETRNLIQRATQDARRLLEHEYREQLEGTFDIVPDTGVIAAKPGEHLDARQRFIRSKIVAAIQHERSKCGSDVEAVQAYLREAAFTTLNRFAALKMMEARKIVLECVSKGEQSAGFREFIGLAPGLSVLPDHGYRLYLECLFDEIGTELGVLFDRRDPASLVWPRRQALTDMLDVLNHAELTTANVWAEDETIGWIYQYFNGDEERKKMREESAAPRNSREMAVRNQFFTPRYVVAFLTDNTLGRIWYEMTNGQSSLKYKCQFLVRRPTEVFLKEGEQPPARAIDKPELSQEELLKQSVFIPQRPLKDPRTILMLDPACGSMHFGLYSFDLFEVIYEEAWQLEETLGTDRLRRPPDMKSLHETYAIKDSFLRDVPRLIIEHNLHGIDIDPRCAQIAGLSLWLRAQKSWQRLGLKAAERPTIRRTNIVCAEPMPGEKELLREFVEQQFPQAEQPLFMYLLEHVFNYMKLAGEAGSLLKIEDEISGIIAEARQEWKEARTRPELFSTPEITALDRRKGIQPELPETTTDFGRLTKDIPDVQFWDHAEERIYNSLRDYAEQAENGVGFRRRLFAEDAVRGFAFIDVCRKCYDVALMNPPFGDCTETVKSLIFGTFGRERIELGGCFITRFNARLVSDGKLGVIANRTLLFAASLDEWRLTQLARTETVLDLGHGVLDALVETAALTLGCIIESPAFFIGVLDEVAKGEHIAICVQQVGEGKSSRGVFRRVSEFRALFGAPFAYWAPASLIAKASQLRPAEAVGAIARQGLATCDNFRFLRLAHEIPFDACGWAPLTKGGEYQPFWADVPLRIKWLQDGAEVKAYIDCLHGQWSRVVQSTNLYGLPGATYSERTASSLSLRVLPRDSIFDKVGPFVGAEQTDRSIEIALTLIGISYTTPYRFLIETSVGLRDGTTSGSAARHYLPSMVQRLPWPECSKSDEVALTEATRGAIEATRELGTANEPNGFWHEPLSWANYASIGEYATARLQSWCGILERIYVCSQALEELGLQVFALDESDLPALEAVAGRNIFSYKRGSITDTAELERLLDLPAEQLIAELVAAGKAHSTIYKKAYWGDRNLELVSHLWETHPLSLLDALRKRPASRKWVTETAWRVLSTSLGFVFGHIQPSDFFRSSAEVLPSDLFSLKHRAKPSETTHQPSSLSIYCDDPNHSADLVLQVEAVLSGYFQGHGPEEICECLGEKHSDLRRVIAQLAFAKHLSDYTDYRRQAPIYWPLSTTSGGYTVWLYYHRLTKDTLYRVQENLEEKFKYEERKLINLRQDFGPQLSAGQRRQLTEREAFVQELREFGSEVARVAPLWNPDLNDGVIINFAPLWRMIAHRPWQKAVKDCWDAVCAGDYDWAHLAMHLWPERVVPKCHADRSLAIAHCLDEFFWEEDEDGKWMPKKVKKAEIEKLVEERTSPAVKEALKSLLEARGESKSKSRKTRR